MSRQAQAISAISQLEIDFEPGLTVRYPTLEHMVYQVCYDFGIKELADLLGFGEDRDGRTRLSTFSRMISPHDPNRLPLDLFVKIVQVTGDKRPVYWLIEKLLNTKQTSRQMAINELTEMIPRLNSLLAQAAAEGAK